MNASLNRKLQRQRGAAMVEFALVVPIFITMFLWSMYLTEIVRMRLHLQEAARYVAFEMTSYNLSDFEKADHSGAYDEAMNAVIKDADEKFKDFDSIEDSAKPPFYIGYENYSGKMKSEDVPVINENILPGTGGPAQFGSAIAGFLNKGIGVLLGNIWKFNMKGRVMAETQGDLVQPFIPKNYNDTGVGLYQKVDSWGGKDLTRKTYKARFAMVADGWYLKDGSDARFHKSGPGKAGVRDAKDSDHQLYTQVGRMTYGGLGGLVNSIPGGGAITSILKTALPIPFPSSYVISKNMEEGGDDRKCNDNEPSHRGEQNLAAPPNSNVDKDGEGPGLDDETLRCFDTIPFRDQTKTADSLYIKIFEARGEYGMGCKKEQATDPTTTTDQNAGDKANRLDCG